MLNAKFSVFLIMISVILKLSLLLLVSCSSSKIVDYFFADEIESTLDSIGPEKVPNFGPSLTSNTNFIDKTSEYGLDTFEAVNFNLVDINRDGLTDIVLLSDYFTQPKFLVFDKSKNKFMPLDYSPFLKPVKASFMYFYDFDGDSLLDAIVGVFHQKTELQDVPLRFFKGTLKNEKYFLKERAATFPVKNIKSTSLGILDYDLDGDLDIFIGNWFGKYQNHSVPKPDVFLENQNGKFVDKTQFLLGEQSQNIDKTMYVNATPTYATAVCDIDQNGFPDVLTASTNGYANKLWMNRYKLRKGIRYFEDFGRVSFYGGDAEGHLTAKGGGRTFATACADYNNDGIMDVFLGELSHNYDSDIRDRSSILTGARLKFPPRFIRTEYFLDSTDLQWHQADRRGVWFDYNNDGLTDLLIDNSGHPPHSRMILFKQLPDHSLVNVAKEVGVDLVNPQSSVVADFNRDGRLDILTAQVDVRDARIKKRVYLFENNTSTANKNYLRVHLRGKKANPLGLGGMVILKVRKGAEVTYRRQFVSYSYGGLAPQNESGLHFGLDIDEKIEYIKVRWPYANSLNQGRSSLEKIYRFKYTPSQVVTLCENGDLLNGKRNCQ
jgi:hypothetical protein